MQALLGILAYLLIPLLFAANVVAFDAAGSSYLRWYVENGPLVSVVVAFLALVWKDRPIRYDLIAANPATYLVGCMRLIAMFLFGLAALLDIDGARTTVLRRRQESLGRQIRRVEARLAAYVAGNPLSDDDEETRTGPESIHRTHTGAPFSAFDLLVVVVMGIVLIVLTGAWLVVIAPVNWLLTLLTGAPDRISRAGIQSRAYMIQGEGQVTFDVAAAHRGLPETAIDISLTREPFAFNQGLNAAVLLVLKLLVT